MDADLKKRWIEALESGDYKQGKGALRSHRDEYCCLGVLCDLVQPDGWSRYNDSPECPDVLTTYYEFVYKNESAGGVLPTTLAKDVDIDSHGAHSTSWITTDNDSGKSFQEIADIIREEF